MKKITTVLLLGIFLLSLGHTADLKKKKSSIFKSDVYSLQNIDIDIDDGTMVMIYEDYDDLKVEITENYELYIDNNKIKTNSRQKKLIKEYYESFLQIIDDAKKIGLEGAKIGMDGAKIGLKAVAGVFKLLGSDYDSEDLEEELEEEAKKLEKQAEKLELKGELLEELADKFEKLHEEMIEEIPELKRLSE